MFWNYFLAGFLSVKVGEYLGNKEYEKMAMKVQEKRDRRRRIEGLEDVLTEEEKQILMDMD